MAQAVQAIGRQTAEGNEHTMTDAKDKIPVQRDRFETWYYEQENHSLRAERMAMSYAEAKAAFDAGWNAAQPAEAQPEPVAQPLHIRALRMADMAIASWENGYAFDAHGPSREAQRLVTEALAAQPAEPVAWLHSKTGRLYDSEEEVPLADGDEWAEPLYAAPAAQQAPAAWRQWSTKQHDWDYQTDKGDLRPDTPAEPLFVAAAQPAPAAVPPAELTWLFTHCRAIGMVEGSESGKWEHDIALFTQRQAERIRVLREALERLDGQCHGEREVSAVFVRKVCRAALDATK